MSWWKWVGPRGDVLGLDRFGASAPGARVLEELGFGVDGILSRARELLRSSGARGAGSEALQTGAGETR
jgi:transketolase